VERRRRDQPVDRQEEHQHDLDQRRDDRDRKIAEPPAKPVELVLGDIEDTVSPACIPATQQFPRPVDQFGSLLDEAPSMIDERRDHQPAETADDERQRRVEGGDGGDPGHPPLETRDDRRQRLSRDDRQQEQGERADKKPNDERETDP
jgi:hypothetical protein